jgi:hypothetical protein
MRSAARLARRAAQAVAGAAITVLIAHFAIRFACRIPPPELAPATLSVSDVRRPEPRVRSFAGSWVVERPGLFEVHLTGDPEAIGTAHARLLGPEMIENEGILLGRFEEAVPVAFFRWLLLDLAQLRYRNLAEGMSVARKRELAAQARAFRPDPYAGFFPTFQRFVYLNGLYDISLSFEHSPLIGCTSFAFSGAASASRGAVLARAFDFEVDPIFDRKKAVFFVRETGKIPFASVAWPGLVGVVSGMNAEGLAVVVHGGRAGNWRTEGEPVVHALRAVLSDARDIPEARSVLARRPALVSHILVLADRAGRAVRVERVPATPDHVIDLGEAAGETNHFRGPAANDPKNQTVLASTSSLPRKRRADELVHAVERPVNAETAVRLLRDRRAAGGGPLALGDRDAIDALIATHGVVFETEPRRLWVSTGPHLLGAFVGFDLARSLAAGAVPEPNAALPTIAADPLARELEAQARVLPSKRE